MTELFFKEESYKIIGACFEVHKTLGHGFNEVVYKDALEQEFLSCKIPSVREQSFNIFYKQQKLKHYFIADFVLYESIVLEIKIGSYIGSSYIKQTVNYLKASRLKLGIVINFGTPSMEFQRVVF